MTTTEPGEIVDDRAARLARLQARRGTSPSSTRTAAAPESVSLSAPTTASIERTAPIDPSPKQTRRRSPATNAKIITIGASTTALLGMMAGYGISDGLTSESTETAAATPVAVTTVPPQVIVVMVDAATGRPISTTTGIGAPAPAAENGAAGSSSTAGAVASSIQPAAPAAPAPVAAPTAVDLAVPAAPRPAPQPASQPQASSGGS